MKCRRIRDGATVDVEQYIGTIGSAVAIAELIGAKSTITAFGLAVVSTGGDERFVSLDNWVIKSKTGWITLDDPSFSRLYHPC